MNLVVLAVGSFKHHETTYAPLQSSRFIRVFFFLFLSLLHHFFNTWMITLRTEIIPSHPSAITSRAQGQVNPNTPKWRLGSIAAVPGPATATTPVSMSPQNPTQPISTVSALASTAGIPEISLFEPNRGEGCASDDSVLVTFHYPSILCCQLHTASFAIKPRRRPSLQPPSNRWASDD